MRLKKARVQNYRSIRDTGWFDVETAKTILVGPNEAGKTAVLRALQQLNAPKGVAGFDPLRDYPRSSYNDITTGKVNPSEVTVVEAEFLLEPEDQSAISEAYRECTYVVGRRLDNSSWHRLKGGPGPLTFGTLRKDLARLAAHVDLRAAATTGAVTVATHAETLDATIKALSDTTVMSETHVDLVRTWLNKVLPLVEEGSAEEKRYDKTLAALEQEKTRDEALAVLWKRLPVFVLFNNYFRVRPLIHLDHLAKRLETKVLDDEQYDYGNKCLLSLLGFSARELSNLGKAAEPPVGDAEALKRYRDQLDKRTYQLNAASVRLSNEIRGVWLPDAKRAEADRLRVNADSQYLKVVVEDDLGVEIELDQRSEGFQWLVSFFIVFFAESAGEHRNAILLLDEPGLSLHGLKQRDFRNTISRLAEMNQAIYTTHSPFLVGPDELDLVRVVEMINRITGTKVHTNVTADDPASLLPLQEALGYDLAQSLFGQQRNLVLEGLTDYWYVEALADLLRESGDADMDTKIALVPASSAGKVVYYATLLHAQRLKVAALLDSDVAGDQAAKQDVLVHALGNKGVLRTKDAYSGPVTRPEIEDMLRETLVICSRSELNWDISSKAASQPARPIIDIFGSEISGFSKYKLAKAFLRWARTHTAADLTPAERSQSAKLIALVNKALK
jgi:hypothetical protein